MSLTQIYKGISQRIEQKLEALVREKGVESEHSHEMVLKVPDEQQFNLDGNRYLTEINELELIDNNGYKYDHSCLTLEQLAEIVDAISGEVDLEADAKAHILQLEPIERHGVLQIIQHVINSRKGDSISDLSYTQLINLKNKLFEA